MEQTIAELHRGRGIIYDAQVVDACLEEITSRGLPWEHDIKSLRETLKNPAFA